MEPIKFRDMHSPTSQSHPLSCTPINTDLKQDWEQLCREIEQVPLDISLSRYINLSYTLEFLHTMATKRGTTTTKSMKMA